MNPIQKKIVCAQSASADGSLEQLIEFIKEAIALKPALDCLKLLQKAQEEFEIGVPERGDTLLDMAFDEAGRAVFYSAAPIEAAVLAGAAPQMLAALEQIAVWSDCSLTGTDRLANVNALAIAAIRKAKGQP